MGLKIICVEHCSAHQIFSPVLEKTDTWSIERNLLMIQRLVQMHAGHSSFLRALWHKFFVFRQAPWAITSCFVASLGEVLQNGYKSRYKLFGPSQHGAVQPGMSSATVSPFLSMLQNENDTSPWVQSGSIIGRPSSTNQTPLIVALSPSDSSESEFRQPGFPQPIFGRKSSE
jgi:hypothetical protein